MRCLLAGCAIALAALAPGCGGTTPGAEKAQAEAPDAGAVTDPLECADPAVSSTPYEAGPGVTGPRHTLPDAWLLGLDNTDVVEAGQRGVVTVSRDGRVVAALALVPASDETWWIETIGVCPGTGIKPDWPPGPAPPDVPDLAVIRCDGRATEIVTAFVRPRPDGLHVRFVNASSGELVYAVSGAEGGNGNGGPPGTREDVFPIGPGRATVICFDPTSSVDPSEIPHEAHLTVVDPEGLHVSTALTACLDGEQFGFFADFAPDAAGERGTPEEVVRAHFDVEPDDLVERAGYMPEGWVRVRIVHDDATVVVATLVEVSGGGWLLGSASGCAGFEPG